MGIFGKKKEKAAERSAAAEKAERKQAEANTAAQAVKALDPSARLRQSTWSSALREKGIEPEAVLAAVDGDLGAINRPGSSAMGMPDRREVGVGAVALTIDRLTYVIDRT